ncbi:MAG: hypothetical protein LBC67_07810 [Spirochaetales bacterium]|jgi:hypothetical protein|nr:hypothetical protein [Spirochaetales bacterium]
MATKIHYEDNIFYAESLLKTVKNGLLLEIDPEYFRDRLKEDILFAGSILDCMYSSLKSNSRLIKKNDYFRGLLRAKRNLAALLDDIIANKFTCLLPGPEGGEGRGELSEIRVSLRANPSAVFEDFARLRAAQKNDCEEIRALVENYHEERGNESDVISSDEFMLLLTPQETSP